MDTMATFVFPPRPSPSSSASPAPSLPLSSPPSAPPHKASSPRSVSPAPRPAPRDTHTRAASSLSYGHLSLSSGRSHSTGSDAAAADDDDDDGDDGDGDDGDDDDEEEHAHAVVRAVRQSRIARPSRARLLSVHELQARARDSDPPPLPLGPFDLPPLPARPPSRAADPPIPPPASVPAPAPAPAPAPLPADNHATVGLGLRAESLPAPTARVPSASVSDSLRPPSAPYSALDVLAGSAIGATSTTPSPPLSAPSPWRPSRASLLDAALDIYAEDEATRDHSSDPPDTSPSPNHNHEDWWRHQPPESDSEAQPTDTDEGPDPDDGVAPGLHPLLPMHLDVLDDPFGMAPLPSLREGATPGPPPPVPSEGLSPGTTPGATPPMRQGALPDRPSLTPGGSPVPPPSALALPAEHVEELTDQECDDPSMSAESGEHSAFPLASPLGPFQGGSYFSLHPVHTHSTSTTTSPGEDRTEGRMALLRAELADAETKLATAKAANATDQAAALADKAAGLKKALVAHHSAVLSRQLARLPTSPSSGPTAEHAEGSTRSLTSAEDVPSNPPPGAKEGNGLLAAAMAALGPSHNHPPSSRDEEQISFAKAMQIIALRAGSMESELDKARQAAMEHTELVAQHRAERTELERQLAEWQAKHFAQLKANEEASKMHDRSLHENEQQARARAAGMAQQLDELARARDALEAQHTAVARERDEWQTKHADLSHTHEGTLEEHASLREKQAELSTSHEALLASHSDLEQAHDTLQGSHADVTRQYTAMVAEHGELETAYANLLSAREDLEGRVRQLEEQVFEAQRARDDERVKSEEHQVQHDALVRHTTELEVKQSQLLASKSELEQQLADASASRAVDTDPSALAEANARAEGAEQASTEARASMQAAAQAAEDQLASLASRLETAARRATEAEAALALAHAPQDDGPIVANADVEAARAEADAARAEAAKAAAEAERLREAMFAQANVANAKLAQSLRALSPSGNMTRQASSDGTGEWQVVPSASVADADTAAGDRSLPEGAAPELQTELAQSKLDELRRAHRELLDKHQAMRAELLETSTALATARQAEQKTQTALLAAQEQAATGVDKLHRLAEMEADLRAAQRAAEEAKEDLALATTQHEAVRNELEQRLAELQPVLEQQEKENSELRAFRAHTDELLRASREERDGAVSRADVAERTLRQLELAVAAERRILSDREGLFIAFERRLETAEARLREEDRRCAEMLGKVDGREEMDNLLLQIKGVTAPKERETAGQNIDSIISSISEHVSDAFDELERRGGRVHRRPGESRSLETETEDEDTEAGSGPRSSDTARAPKPGETEALTHQLNEMLTTLKRYEHELAEQAQAAQTVSNELKSAESDRAALEQTVAELRQALDAARQETQDKAVQTTLLQEQLEKAQATAGAVQNGRTELPGTQLEELLAKTRTLQRTVSSLEQELAASRTRVAELETRLVSALRSGHAGSGALDEHPELPGLALRLDAAEQSALEAQHATAELNAERMVLRAECQRLAAERASLSAALKEASKQTSSAPRSSSPVRTPCTALSQCEQLSSEPEEMEMLAPAPVVVRELAPSSPTEPAQSEYLDAQADVCGGGEDEAGFANRTLAPMSPESATHARSGEQDGLSMVQLTALREEHARLRVQFNGLHEQYELLRAEHEQVAREAAATRVELQSTRAVAVADMSSSSSNNNKHVAKSPSMVPSGVEMSELIALFPQASPVGQLAPSVTPSMGADGPSSHAKNRLAGTWPSPVTRSRSPGVTLSTASSGSGKVDVSSLRSRFEQRSTNPSSPVMDRGTPASTPGHLTKPLPTPATPISRAGSTPPVVNPSSAGKHTPLDWTRVVTEVKEMRSLIHALRAQVTAAQTEKARLERFLTSMRGLLDKSIETVSQANTPAHSEIALPMNGAPGAVLDEALSIVERDHGLEIPSPVLSSSSAPTAGPGPARNPAWGMHRTPPQRAPSSTSTASFSQSRAASRADRQRAGGPKSFKLQPVPPIARVFEPTSSEGDVPPVPSLPHELKKIRRAPSMSRPSSQASVRSQPPMGHASKPSSLRTMTLGMDGRQLTMRVRDLDDAVVALEAEKRQAQSQIRALQDALSEAYNEMHVTTTTTTKSDLSGLKLPGSASSTPPRDLSSSRENSVPTSISAENLTPPPVEDSNSTPTPKASTGQDESSKTALRPLTLDSTTTSIKTE